jgi:hypothetical protein
MVTNEKQTRHEITCIKPCSPTNKMPLPFAIKHMPPKGLAKAKSRLALRTQAMDLKMRLITTWEHNWWS